MIPKGSGHDTDPHACGASEGALGVEIMTETWLLAALWLGLALVATLLSIWLRVASAVVPTLIANAFFPPRHLLKINVDLGDAVSAAPGEVAKRV
jgi:hypothetical protein